jgi:hypothetical protein
MSKFYIDLVVQIWAAVVSALGTTTLALFVAVSIAFCIWSTNLIQSWYKGGFKMNSLKIGLKPSYKIVLTLIAWVLLFGYFVAKTVYDNHRIANLKIDKLQTTVADKDRKIVELENKLRTKGAANIKDNSFHPSGDLTTSTLVHRGGGIMGDISIQTSNNCGVKCYDSIDKNDDPSTIVWNLKCVVESCHAIVNRSFNKGLYCEPSQLKNCTYNVSVRSR